MFIDKEKALYYTPIMCVLIFLLLIWVVIMTTQNRSQLKEIKETLSENFDYYNWRNNNNNHNYYYN